MIHKFNVGVRNDAEKPIRHQPALYFVPNLAKTRIEFLSLLLFFHEAQSEPLADFPQHRHDDPCGQRIAEVTPCPWQPLPSSRRSA